MAATGRPQSLSSTKERARGMHKIGTYYKHVIDNSDKPKLKNPAYYLNARAFIEREAELVEQKRQTSREGALVIEDYLKECFGFTAEEMRIKL